MKRTIALLISVCLLALIGFCGCGKNGAAEPETKRLPTDEQDPKLAETTGTEGIPNGAASEERVEPETTETSTETADSSVPEPPAEDWAEAKLQQMSLEEKLAQMFVATPEALTGIRGPATVAGETTRAAFDRIPVGGILYMGKNLENPGQVQRLLAGTRQISLDRIGLVPFLCVDEEGGQVARISGNPAFGVAKLPPMAELGAAGDPEAVRETGRIIGAYLRELGFNLDFAPCADVLTNPENRIVRSRSFSSDPALVTAMAKAFSEGLTEQGILPCWKHFPGHGGTAEDSHLGFAVLHMDMETLEQSPELAPFLEAAAWGVPMIMTGHISVPEAAGDDRPASLSGTLLGLLRGPETRYDGLLITDALDMGAVANRYSPGEAAVMAVQAGNDLLLTSANLEDAYNAVLAAVREGRIRQERIDESVYRILKAKEGLP